MSEVDDTIGELNRAYALLQEKVAKGGEVTLQEFKCIVVPWVRQHREVTFALHEVKEKVIRVTKKALKEQILAMMEKHSKGELLDASELEIIQIHYSNLGFPKRTINALLGILGMYNIHLDEKSKDEHTVSAELQF